MFRGFRPYVNIEGYMKKKNLNYMAGIVDGEGCIHVKKYKDIRKRTVSPSYELSVSISNCRYELIDYFKYYFGGMVQTIKGNDKHNTSYRLYFFTWEAENFLKEILPYLFLKKEEAITALTFRKTYKQNVGSRKVPEKTIKIREECNIRLRELKRKTFE